MAFSLRRWLGTLKELKWRQDYNENMKDIEDKINELEANNSLLGDAELLFNGTLAPSGEIELPDNKWRNLLLIVTGDAAGTNSTYGQAIFSPNFSIGYIPVMYGTTQTYMRINVSATHIQFLAAGHADLRIKRVYALLRK